MKRHRTATTAAAILGVLALLPGMAPASGAPGGAGPEAVTQPEAAVERALDPAATFLANERGISAAEAAQRIEAQDTVLARLDGSGARGQGTFAGAWVDGEDVPVIAATTDEGRRSLQEALGPDLAEQARFTVVRYSQQELTEATDWFYDQISQLPMADRLAIQTREDTPRNRVVFSLPAATEPTKAQLDLQARAEARFGSLVAVDHVGDPVKTHACTVGPTCDPPLRAGLEYRIDYPAVPPNFGGTTGCSGAFLARSVFDNELYVMTAGHCHWGTWKEYFTDGSLHVVGDRHSSEMGQYGDFGLVAVNNEAGWQPRAWAVVLASNGNPPTSANHEYRIAAEGSTTIGQSLCKTGATTGTTCGFVTSTGGTVTYGNPFNVTVGNLAFVNLLSQPGDSGAPMYRANTAYGILGGGNGSGTFYSGIGIAEARLNVEVSNEWPP